MLNVFSFRSFLILALLGSAGAMDAASADDFSNKVNLALRQTADALLLYYDDSTTVIPPISQNGTNEYVLEMKNGFSYRELPHFLGKAFKDYGIDQPYEIMVRSCETGFLVLGYNRAAAERDSVACRERLPDMPCATIHVQFTPQESKEEKSLAGLAWLLVPAAGLGGIFLFRKKENNNTEESTEDGMKLGKYRFNSKSQKLSIGDETFELTFRESKLLAYFAERPNKVLAREEIQSAVWGDEGVIVGRSLDVFISRLRKLLASDNSVTIKTIHGVGYRLEVHD